MDPTSHELPNSQLGAEIGPGNAVIGNLEDLNQAVHHYSCPVELTTDDHTSKPSLHNNLENLFIRHFE